MTFTKLFEHKIVLQTGSFIKSQNPYTQNNMSGRSSRRRNDGEGGGNMMAEMLPNLLMGALDLLSKHNQPKKRDRQRQHRHRLCTFTAIMNPL